MTNYHWKCTDGMMRPCKKCGSWNLQWMETDEKHGHQLKYVCEDCGYKSQAIKRDPNGKSDREYQAEWRSVIMQRANGKCEICGADAEEAHHKSSYRVMCSMGLSIYEIWATSNGIALCKKCHDKWHKKSLEVETLYDKMTNNRK